MGDPRCHSIPRNSGWFWKGFPKNGWWSSHYKTGWYNYLSLDIIPKLTINQQRCWTRLERSHLVYGHLVGGWPTHLKNMSSSVGMMTFPIYGKYNMFQTTNQSCIVNGNGYWSISEMIEDDRTFEESQAPSWRNSLANQTLNISKSNGWCVPKGDVY